MPRVRVVADDGWVALDEIATPQQLDTEHARRGLAERIWWAAWDAAEREAGARPGEDRTPALH